MKFAINIKKTKYIKIIKIANAPKLLIFSLQRLDFFNNIKKFVEFNKTI